MSNLDPALSARPPATKAPGAGRADAASAPDGGLAEVLLIDGGEVLLVPVPVRLTVFRARSAGTIVEAGEALTDGPPNSAHRPVAPVRGRIGAVRQIHLIDCVTTSAIELSPLVAEPVGTLVKTPWMESESTAATSAPPDPPPGDLDLGGSTVYAAPASAPIASEAPICSGSLRRRCNSRSTR